MSQTSPTSQTSAESQARLARIQALKPPPLVKWRGRHFIQTPPESPQYSRMGAEVAERPRRSRSAELQSRLQSDAQQRPHSAPPTPCPNSPVSAPALPPRSWVPQGTPASSMSKDLRLAGKAETVASSMTVESALDHQESKEKQLAVLHAAKENDEAEDSEVVYKRPLTWAERGAEEMWSFMTECFSIDQFDLKTPLEYFDIEDRPPQQAQDAMERGSRPKSPGFISTQHFPAFTLVQTTIALALWLVFSFGQGDDSIPWTLKKAGLDSIWPGKTDLRVGLECEDSRYQIWRWWSYQFTHMGTSHVMMNSLLNLLLGVSIEGFHGTWRTFVMYNVGVFGGACCYLVYDVHHPAVGMSGGCYSLIGMHLGAIVMNWRQRKYRWAKLFFLCLLAVADIMNATLAVSHGDTKVSHCIHFGGYVGGVLVSVVIGRNLVVKRWERWLCLAALLLGCALAVFCVSWGTHWPPQNIGEDAAWCWSRQVSNFGLFGNADWQCVRCGSQACIDKWSKERYIAKVSMSSCDKRGGWLVTEP